MFSRGHPTATIPRLRGQVAAQIDDRHVIRSLVRKPGACVGYRYREEMFPTPTFRRAYDALPAAHGGRADVEYIRVLRRAASTLESPACRALRAGT